MLCKCAEQADLGFAHVMRYFVAYRKQVRILKSQLESGVRVKGQLNEWFATHRPDDIMDDIHSGRVTFLEADLVSY